MAWMRWVKASHWGRSGFARSTSSPSEGSSHDVGSPSSRKGGRGTAQHDPLALQPRHEPRGAVEDVGLHPGARRGLAVDRAVVDEEAVLRGAIDRPEKSLVEDLVGLAHSQM